MKKFVVLILALFCCSDVFGVTYYPGFGAPGYGNRAVLGGPNCAPRRTSGSSDNEVVHAVSQISKEYYHFRCETTTGCHKNTYIAILGEACINSNSGCHTNAVFVCWKGTDDKWLHMENDGFSVCKKALDGVALKQLGNSHRVLIHGDGIYEDFVVGTKDVCFAYKCNDGYKLNSDGSKCVSDKEWCENGAVENRSCAYATTADGAKCKYVCKNNEWYYDSVVSCNPGYVPVDGGCKKEDCADKLNGLNAKAAKKISDDKCIATECKSGAYLVRKDGVDQGYCVYPSYCKESGETLNIIDGKYTDLKCNKAEKSQTESNSSSNGGKDSSFNITITFDAEDKKDEGYFLGAAAQLLPASVEITEVQDESKQVEQRHVTGKGCTADEKSQCVIKGVRIGDKIQGSYVGYDDEIVEITEENKDNFIINMKSKGILLEDVTVVECGIRKESGWAATKAIEGTCYPTKCIDGYNLEGSEKEAKCVPEKEKTTDSGLNEEESQAKIEDLRAESDAAHEKENSTANKLLGAAGISATGIGAMQMMSGMAEQNADEDAENQMKAYLATFRCNYGGLSHKGGEMAIELPGAGDLLPLYTEYVNLANDLKIRKAALDMRPGIEAEAILDGATSGLYDDVHTGKTTGMYTSLARALSDPNGEDAKKWQEQKDAAAKKKKTGMITAAVGAAGSLVGNLIINRDKKDKETESDEEIAKKYKPVSDLATNVSNSTPPTAKCPSDTTGTYPKCEKNAYVSNEMTYNPTSNKLEPQSKVDTEKVVAAEKQREQDKLENNKEGSVTVNLPSVNMFEINSANLTAASKRNLNDFIKKLEATGAEDCSIELEGFTDPVGDSNYNIELALQRANAVGRYLDQADTKNIISNWSGAAKNGDIYGYGCTCMTGINPNTFQVFADCSREEANNPEYKECCGDKYWTYHVPTRYAPCRRVEMTVECDFPDDKNIGNITDLLSGISKGAVPSDSDGGTDSNSDGSVSATAVLNGMLGNTGGTKLQLIDTKNLF